MLAADSYEARRISALYALEILDTPQEASYDRITMLCRMAFDVPIVAISLLDADRAWFKSRQGLGMSQVPRTESLCNLASQHSAPLVIEDTTRDSRVKGSGLLTGECGVRFYAGAPLVLATGENVGTLCIMDTIPRQLSPVRLATLQRLADLIVKKLELRGLVARVFWEVDHEFDAAE